MNKLKKIFKYIYLLIKDYKYTKKNKIIIYNTQKTLEKLINENLSISRFGDGEIDFILGKGSPSQKYEKDLAEILRDILKRRKKSKNHVIAIPYVWATYSGYTLTSIKFWLVYLIINRKKIYNLLDLNYHYYDSQITRIYINRSKKEKSVEYFEMWKKLWNNKNVLVVEGEYSKLGTENDLLNNTKNIKRIICPSKNAFSCYEKIKIEILKNYKNTLVLLLLGPTATVLAWDLASEGIQTIDLGNLDMEYEWLKTKVKKKTKIEGKYSYEVLEGENILEKKDEKYEKEIICKIKNMDLDKNE